MMGRLSRSSRARGPAWRLAAWAVATALMVEVVGFAVWRTYDGWRRGRVVLTNDGPPLTVQVLDESGEVPIGEPFDLVTDSTLALPDGDYRLRVNGVGRLGQTYRLAVNRGETIAHRLSLEPALDRGEAIARRRSFDQGQPPAGGRPPLEIGKVVGVAALEIGSAVGVAKTTGPPDGHPIDPGFEPVRAVQSADLDGDGAPEVLALRPGLAKGQQSLVASSSATGRPLWTATVNASFTRPGERNPPSEWPWLVDLDGDGRSEVVVPHSGPMPLGGRGCWGLQVLDGAMGQSRWVRPMGPVIKDEDGVARLTDAPDLDGDGIRDLVAVSLFTGRQAPPSDPRHPFGRGRVCVDALSSKDGRTLWFWTRDLPPSHYVLTWAPRWWGRGPDGWPLLAVPLGGEPPTEWQKNFVPSPLLWPVVHVLEGSTGRELHTIPGLYRPDATDLDGDGIDDLRGEVDGRLRAFPGRPPEAWRAIGRFKPAGEDPRLDPIRIGRPDANGRSAPSHEFTRFRGASDLDGDGIGDVLIDEVDPDDVSRRGATVRRTAIARSGRDGHLIWKAVLDRPRFWDEPHVARGISYELSTFPLPAGDLDGDGTPDVIVTRNEGPFGWQLADAETRGPATLPLQALSGHTGRRLWSAGPLLPGSASYAGIRIEGFDSLVVHQTEQNEAPDVLVEYRTPHVWPDSPRVVSLVVDSGGHRMARLSGRDGRVVWDVLLSEIEQPAAGSSVMVPPLTIPLRHFGDLNGDGFLDAILVDSPAAEGSLTFGAGQDITLEAISLKDGGKLWTRRFPVPLIGPHQLLLAVGDIDADRRDELLVANAVKSKDWRDQSISQLNALDGPDGRVLWTWQGRARLGMDFLGLWLARVEGGRRHTPLVAMGDSRQRRRLVRLDARGGVAADRELPSQDARGLEAADVDGDGNDELLLSATEGLSILGPDLKEAGSRRPLKAPDGFWYLASGPPGSVVSAPALGLDGPKWQPLRGHLGGYARDDGPWLLGPGDAARRPFWMVGNPDATICRSAPPILSNGRYAPPRGTSVRPGHARDDPRWARPLPWIEPIRRALDPRLLVAAVGLAMINVIVPIAIIRLAAWRRPWSLRMLMVLPIAVAIPLAVFQARESLLPARIGPIPATARPVFLLGTLAGLPILIYIGSAVSGLFRGRWRRPLALLGLTIVATSIVGVAWLWWDRRTMPAIEHYDSTNLYLIVLPGAYAAGVVLLIAWPLRRIFRWIKRSRRQPSTRPN
jgi:hypothetical protein